MKQRIYNGHSLEFFDSSNVKKGELLASGSFIVMPSGSDRGLVLGQVSGFARIGSTAGSLFLGGGSTSEIQVQNNLIPDGDSVRNLGATNRFFANVYADSITVGTNDTLVGDASATGNSGLLLSSGQNVFITFDTNGTGADEFRVGHGSGNSALLSIKNATSKFANQLAVKTPTAFTAATSADDLVIGSGVGNQGMTIYSGDSNAGSIHFADDLDEEGAGDSPAGNRDGVIKYEHNNSQFNIKTGGNQNALTVAHNGSEFASSVTSTKVNINQAADEQGLEIKGYDDHSSSDIKLQINGAGHARLSQTTNGASGYLFLQAENYLQLIAGTFVYTQNQIRIYDQGSIAFGSNGDFLAKYYDSADEFRLTESTSGTKGLKMDTDGNVTFTEDVVVEGTITAQEFKTEFVSSSIVYMSGSTKFGDTSDDNHNFTGSVTIEQGNFTIAGNDTGERLYYEKANSTLNINHDTDDAGLEIYTVGSAQPTTHQVKIGRDSGQYLGIRVDDGRSYFIHRQDESGGSDNHHQTNQIWTSGGGTHTWNWDIANNSGGSPSNKLQLASTGYLKAAGTIESTGGNLKLGADVEIFRDGVNILRTDDTLHANANIHVGGDGKLFDRANTANFIELANTIRISTNTIVDGTLQVGTGGSIQPLLSRDSSTGGLIVSSNGNSGDFIFKGSGGNEKFRIVDSGNVGINAASPTHRLTVNSGATNVVAKFKSSDNQAWISVQDDDSGTYGALFGTDSDSGEEIVIANKSATKRFSIDSNGKTKLHAYGSGNRTGTAAYNIQVDSGGNLIETEAGGGGGGAVSAVTNGANDRVATFTSATALNGESGLTYSSTTGMLKVQSAAHAIAQLHGGGAEHGTLTFHSSSVVSATMGYHQQGYFFVSANSVNPNGEFFIRGDLGITLGANNTGSLSIKSGSSADVIIDSKVKLGVGLSSPSSLLHVDAPDGKMVDTFTAYIRNREATAGDNFGLGIQAGSNSSDVSFEVRDQAGTSLLRVRGDGNIGIGTTSPNRLLQVRDTSGTASIAITSANTGTAQLELGGTSDNDIAGISYNSSTQKLFLKTNNTPQLHIDNSGNVGIGTDTPGRQMELKGQAVIRLNADSTDPGLDFVHAGTQDMQLRYRVNTNKLAFYSYGTNSDIFTIQQSNGYVGINTTSPDRFLEIFNEQDGDFYGLKIAKLHSNTNQYTAEYANNQIKFSGNQNFMLYNDTSKVADFHNSKVTFHTNGGSERMRINSSGAVGIGTTSPVRKLHVEGNSGGNELFLAQDTNSTLGTLIGRFKQLDGTNNPFLNIQSTSTGMLLNTGFTTGIPGSFVLQSNGGSSYLAFQTNGANERMRITSTGAVVIGSATPDDVGGQSKLSVDVGSGQGSFRLQNGGTDGVYFRRITTGGHYQLQTTLDNGNAGVLSLQSYGGNVGIGNVDPSEKLEVTGFIKVSGSAADSLGITFDRAGLDTYQLRHLDGGLTVFNHTDSRKEMTFLGNGNIGIGTNNPGNLLHIHTTGNGSSALIVEDDARRLELGRDMIAAKSADGSTVQNLYIQPAGTTAFATTSGKVGIGTTGPKQQFHVHGGSSSGSVTKAVIGGTGGNGESHLFLAEHFSGDDVNYGFSFVADGNDSNNLLIKNHDNSTTGNVAISVQRGTGNVGVGINPPTAQFQVNGTSTIGWSDLNNARILAGSSGAGIGIDSNEIASKGDHLYIGTISAKDVKFRTNGVNERLTISSAGNVGINKTTPTAGRLVIREDSGYAIRTENASGYTFRVSGSGLAEFGGNVVINKSTPTLTFNNLAGGGLDPILEATGNNFNIKTTSITPLSVNLSTGNATLSNGLSVGDSGAVFGTDNQPASIFLTAANRGISGEFSSGYARNLIRSDGSATIQIGEQSGLISLIKLDAGSSSVNGVVAFLTKQQERMRVHHDGKVGIGTTSPTGQLDIVNSQTFASNKNGASTGLLSLYNSNNAGGAGIIFCDNVGSSYNASQKGSIAFYHSDSASQGGGASFHIASTEPNLAVIAGSSSQNGRFLAKSGASNTLPDFSFFDDPNTGMSRNGADKLKLITGGTPALHINASQRVGIGTETPASILHINTGTGTGNANTVILDRPASSDYNAVSFATAGTVDWSIGQNSAGNLEIFEDGLNSKTRLTVRTGGNVGIGAETPGEKLEVNGAIKVGNLKIANEQGGRIGFNRNTSNGAIYDNSGGAFQVQNNLNDKLEIQAYTSGGTYGGSTYITDDMKVGIGISTPSGRLHIKTSTDTGVTHGLIIERNNASSDKGYINYQGGAFRMVATDGDPLKFGHVSNDNRLEIQSDGTVLIAGDLQVNGTTTTVNSTNLDLSDNIIGLNRGLSGANANDSGIIIERGSSGNNAAILWDESDDLFVLGLTTSTPSATGNIALSDFRGLKTGPLTASGNITTTSNSHLVLSRKFAARDANGVMLTADDGLSGLSIADNGEASFSTNVSTAGQLTVGDSNADILQVGLKSVVTYGENTDIDTTTGDIKSLPIATYQAAFFDYVIKKGTNIRSGTVTAAHDGTNITFNEVSTIDLGDTTDVTLQVVKSGSNMVFQAVTLSNDWSVKAFVRAIKV